MKRRIMVCLFITAFLLISALAELPPAPPPAPEGLEEQEQSVEPQTIESTTDTDSALTIAAVPTTSSDASVQELQQKISSLEAELSTLRNKSWLLSTPFIISLSVNITLLILVFYLLKKAKEQTPQY